MKIKLVAAAFVAAIGVAGAANAGGYAAPAVDVPAPVLVQPSAAPMWQGGYLGGTLGYACCGDDRVGFHVDDVYQGDIGTLKIGGLNGGIRAGYRWQHDQWVFGPELGYEIGRISDDLTHEGAPASSASNDVNSVLALRFKTGRVVDQNTIVYGIAGIARGDFDYEVDDVTENFKANGYVLGLGAERLVSDRMSVTGEWEYANFGSTDIDYDAGTTVATPKYHNFRVGLNYRF
ncbi:MAG: porin family protein [Paracoccus sp. (in: a-proteobacteria)]|nr:porin family protein [Paracoccus sp. (in: a-proteobacteria)]